jgi:uncharacterized membrane protein YfcA
MNINSSFQNPRPQAHEYTSQALHKFVVALYDGMTNGSFGGGGGALAIPAGQTGFTVAYYGSTNNIQTVTYADGTVLTLTYVSGGAADDDLIATATVS